MEETELPSVVAPSSRPVRARRRGAPAPGRDRGATSRRADVVLAHDADRDAAALQLDGHLHRRVPGPAVARRYCAETGQLRPPGAARRFLDYGNGCSGRSPRTSTAAWSSRVDRDGDGFRLGLEDGDRLRARRVVVAAAASRRSRTGRPSPRGPAARTRLAHRRPPGPVAVLAGRRVLVVGGGQSALESAALLHEAGAEVEVVVAQGPPELAARRQVPPACSAAAAPLVYAPTDVGPMGLSRLVAVPDLFRRLPRAVQDPLAYRAIRPAGAAWLRPRLADVPIRLGRDGAAPTRAGDRVRVQLDRRRSRTVDHVLLGTGYRVDITRYPFLAPDWSRRCSGPAATRVLRPRAWSRPCPVCTSSARPAAWSFGPIMRFVVRRLVRRPVADAAVAGARPTARRARSAPAPVEPVTRRDLGAPSRRSRGRRGLHRRGRRGDRRRLPGPGHRAQPRPARHPGRASSTTSGPSRGRRATSPHDRARAGPARRASPAGRADAARRPVRPRRVGAVPDPGRDRRRARRAPRRAPPASGCPPGLALVRTCLGQARDVPAGRAARRSRTPDVVPAGRGRPGGDRRARPGGRQARDQGALLLRDRGQGVAGRHRPSC